MLNFCFTLSYQFLDLPLCYVVVIVTLMFPWNLILLDLLFLHLCFIQFSMYNSWRFLVLVGSSGLEPPTSCLSGTRSNLLSYEPMWLVWCFSHSGYLQFRGKILLFPRFEDVGIELSSRAASRKVFSPLQSLTSVFGMGTGGPSAFRTLTIFFFQGFLIPENWTTSFVFL